MRRLDAAILLVFLTTITASTPAQDGARPGADDALDRLEKAIREDPGLSPATKAAFEAYLAAQRAAADGATDTSLDKKQVEKIVEDYLAANPPLGTEASAWEAIFERISFYGDLRLRHESSFDLDSQPDRHRERFRLRLGANYQLLEELLVGARVTTGNADDPNSPHVTLGTVFDSYFISIDRAFVTYQPSWLEGAFVTAGKFSHPFRSNPVYGELVWDGDVQPEGIVAGYTTTDLGPLDRVDLRAGEYLLLEQGMTEEAVMSVFQVATRVSPIENLVADGAVGFYYYSDVTPDGSAMLLADNQGNATVDRDGDGNADNFQSDFSILNPIVSLTWNGLAVPVTIAGEYLWNLDANGTEDQGWAAGVAVGSTKVQGDWRCYYQYQVVEQDATFAAFAQDDFLLATNHCSHLFGIQYQLFDQVGLRVWGLISSREGTTPGIATADSDKGQWRVRLDLNIRF